MEGLKASKLIAFAGAALALSLFAGCAGQDAAQKAQAAATQAASSAQGAEAAANSAQQSAAAAQAAATRTEQAAADAKAAADRAEAISMKTEGGHHVMHHRHVVHHVHHHVVHSSSEAPRPRLRTAALRLRRLRLPHRRLRNLAAPTEEKGGLTAALFLVVGASLGCDGARRIFRIHSRSFSG